MDLDKFDAEVREIYNLLHGRKQEDFPAITKYRYYKALFNSAQENGPEDFTFRQDFEEPDRLLEKMRDRSFSYLKSICESAENIRKA